MRQKIIGSVLMILGTCVGAGMLALPIVSAQQNILLTLSILGLSWFVMTIGALSLLEVNLWLPTQTNMISMAGITLGPKGKICTWIVYLFLLYSLICAYLSGLSDITHHLLVGFNISISKSLTTILVLFLFGVIVYKGIALVDILNRGLMSIKLFAYILVIALTSNHLTLQMPFVGNYHGKIDVLMVMLTSFGFAIIVPSLRYYLNNNIRVLKKVVLVGSLLPLIIYSIWIFVIQAVIPKSGADGLIAMLHATNPNSMLMSALSTKISTSSVVFIINIFISVCALTSFLGVSICLTDFIADGLALEKKGKQGLIVSTVVFLPPLIIVLLAPGIFVRALQYAGLGCLILLILIPLLMLYYGRYKKNLSGELLLPGRSFVLSLITLVSIFIGLYLYTGL